MKKKYKKTGGEKGNSEVLHNAIRNVEGKIHKLSEEEWREFKESFRENFLMAHLGNLHHLTRLRLSCDQATDAALEHGATLMVLGFQEKEEYLAQQ